AAVWRAGRIALVQKDVINVVEKVVDDRPVGVLPQIIHATGNRTGGVERIVRACRITVRMHENVSLDPRVGAVQIEMVVTGPIENVVDDLKNCSGPLAASEINR